MVGVRVLERIVTLVRVTRAGLVVMMPRALRMEALVLRVPPHAEGRHTRRRPLEEQEEQQARNAKPGAHLKSIALSPLRLSGARQGRRRSTLRAPINGMMRMCSRNRAKVAERRMAAFSKRDPATHELTSCLF